MRRSNCRAGMGPIPEVQNPHATLAAYAKDLDIVVFNGHVHTTELFQADGVKYFVLGGGAPSKTLSFPVEPPSRTFRRTTRRICIGKANLPGRSTTTCMSR